MSKKKKKKEKKEVETSTPLESSSRSSLVVFQHQKVCKDKIPPGEVGRWRRRGRCGGSAVEAVVTMETGWWSSSVRGGGGATTGKGAGSVSF